MRISQDELERRLSSNKNLARSPFSPSDGGMTAESTDIPPSTTSITHKQKEKTGPQKGAKYVTEETREIIGMRAALGESRAALAKEYGKSYGSIQSYENGTGRGTANPPTLERREAIAKREEVIRDVALTKLMQAFNLLDEDKLSELDAHKLSGAIANISRVAANLRAPETNQIQANIVIYSPEVRSDDKFKVIDV